MTFKQNPQCPTTSGTYNEAAALQQLLVATKATISHQSELLEAEKFDEADNISFTITIGGVQTEFFLLAPQAQALFNFIDSLASENDFTVDYRNNTVTY